MVSDADGAVGFFFANKRPALNVNNIDIIVGLFLCFSSFRSSISGSAVSQALLPIAILVCYAIVKYLIDDRNTKKLIAIATVFLIIHVLVGLLQSFNQLSSNNEYFKITGPFFNPAPYIIYTSTLFIVVLPYFFRGSYAVLFWLFVLPSFLYLLVLTDSRTSWVASILSIITSLLVYYRTRTFSINEKIFTIGTFLICLVYFVPRIITYKIDSALGRIFIWKNSFHIILDNFLVGVGDGNFDVTYFKYQADFFAKYDNSTYLKLAGDIRFAFNDYIQIFCENGLIGLLLFLSIIIVIFQPVVKCGSFVIKYRLLMSSSIALVFLLASSLFSYTLQLVETQILFWLIVAIISNQLESKELIFPRFSLLRSSKGHILTFVFVIIIGTICSCFSAYRWYAFTRYTNSLDNPIEVTNSIANLTNLSRVLGDDPNFIIYYSDLLFQDGKIEASIAVLEEATRFTPEKEYYYTLGYLYETTGQHFKAEQVHLLMTNTYPNLLYPKYLLAMYYYRTDQKAKWKASAENVLYGRVKVESETTNSLRASISKLLLKSDK